MKDIVFDDFQNCVDDSLIRHASILDVLTKLQESEGRINRAIVKSVTSCGCISIKAEKQHIPQDEDDINVKNLKKYLKTHVEGNLCDNCKDIVENEIGNNIFYIAAICNILDINLYDIMLKELNKTNTLGKFNLR